MKRTKVNNDSYFFKDWSTPKLKEYALEYDGIVHGESACYGSSDIQILDGVLAELDNRGIKITSKIEFN